MKFLSIEMNNWLIFRGKQKVLFPQDDHANILIIFGENMHGKTSLLNAVRWALYGKALDRQKREVLDNKLLNIDAKTDGENSFSVTLKIESDGRSYEIFRSAEVSPGKTSTSLILKENNRVQDGGEVSEAKIEGLVPEQISQFLLFDGELLNQFEQLVVDEAGPQASAIKISIEKALGLPVLQRANEELGSLQKSMSKVFQNEMKQDRILALLVRNLEKHENDLTSKMKEKASLEEQIGLATIRISELDAILERSNKDIGLSERKKLLVEELAQNKKEITRLEEALKSSMANVWREPLSSALVPHVKEINFDISALSEKRRNAEVAFGQVFDLEKALKDSLCSQCGNKLASDQQTAIQAKLDTIKSSTLDTAELDKQIALLQQKLGGITFSGIETSISLKILNFSDLKTKASRRNIKISDELFEIRNALDDFDEESGRKVKAEYNMRMKEIGRQTQNSLSIDGDIQKIELEINMIKKNSDYKHAVKEGGSKNSFDTCEALLTIFKSAVSNYRDSMRNKVGARASDTFKNLTTEKSFDHLQINKSYGLNLIIEGKQVARSAGAEQIVALSLIEALNYHGRRKGPMLMDTPAGRLDKSHRKNVMDYLPKVVTQLAFFAHSGELTDEDIYFDRSKIGRKYQIKRVGPFHSVLEDV